jgi:hypothetical protein
VDGMMTDDEVDCALRRLCKCSNPFLRYVRLKEVGAGYILFNNIPDVKFKEYSFEFLERLAQFILPTIQSPKGRMNVLPLKRLICLNSLSAR